jgi:hypothetical protein
MVYQAKGIQGMSKDIGSLIVSTPEIQQGRPCIAGVGITVHRIAIWYKLGYSLMLIEMKSKLRLLLMRLKLTVLNKSI